MKIKEKELKEINGLLNKTLEIIEGTVKKPSKLREDNALDVTLQGTAILQKILLERFGKVSDEVLLNSVKEIMKITVDYYNAHHGKKLGFVAKLKKKFFK